MSATMFLSYLELESLESLIVVQIIIHVQYFDSYVAVPIATINCAESPGADRLTDL